MISKYFSNRLYNISEGNQDNQKDHFIVNYIIANKIIEGVFQKGVKAIIENNNNDIIPYSELITYGDIISIIKAEGMQWCNQIKEIIRLKSKNNMIKQK